ncbi:hypothetical protein BSL78_09025 [Apostichopus japonicus]|uniref:Uncharacterized protein n=1 Tax=Stichopus japonicus TaxID=307972 RepID=A0A2G8L1G8_STIJA|nr:hypothetical protein BSL78_09025 [Apostichopus japonicus]
MISTDRDEGQTAESQPQESQAGIIRADDYSAEEVRAAAGLKNLKSMFEKGGVSNIQARAEREKIEVKALGEADEGPAQGVAENVPKEREVDVVTAGSDLERAPKSLEDFSQDESNKSVSESTPLRRDDVVRSDEPLEEQAHLAEGTRSLLTRWEKGEVEHAEEKPKEVIGDAKDMKADMQFSESEPAVRGDLVRESDETDEAIPEGVTKGIRQNIEGGAEFQVEVNVVAEDEPKRLSEGTEEEQQGEEEECAQFEVNVEVNGNLTPEENGHREEDSASTPNGHYQNDDDSAEVDPSAEIKAARAAAMEEEEEVDEGQAEVLVDIS